MHAWHDDPRLRLATLEQLAEHMRLGRLDWLAVGEQRVEIYGWERPRDLGALERALGIPANLLALGLHLFEGFPLDPIGTREHIDGVRTLLRAALVGADLSGVVPAFICWRLVEQPSWPDLPASLRDLLLRVALTVLEPTDNPALEHELLDSRERWMAKARGLGRAVDSSIYDNVTALHLAASAYAQLRDPSQASGLALATASIAGCPPPPISSAAVSQQEQTMRDELLTRMRAAAFGLV